MTYLGATYERYKKAAEGIDLPAMFVDLEAFDANVRKFVGQAKSQGKTIRPASKSIRVPALLKRVFEIGGESIKGVMCFSAAEAKFLGSEGFDDLLIAYPISQKYELETVASTDKKVTVMADSIEQLDWLDKTWDADRPLRVCFDIDMSLVLLGGLIRIGVQRSSIRNIQDLKKMLDHIEQKKNLTLAGLMGYEAQVAGLPDENPFAPTLNWAKQLIRKWSVTQVAHRRALYNQEIIKRGIRLDFFNGGGTGSMSWTPKEDWLSEVTVGSGFLQSHLFDYYSENVKGLIARPAFCFALPVTRKPQADYVTCHSGGYISSGEPGLDKAPVPFLPPGLKPVKDEGFGEVQTPFHAPGLKFELGDPIFCRPSKAGEVAERFMIYHLIEGDKVVGQVPTYRGQGQCFY